MKKALFLGLIALGFAASQAKADVSFGISFGGGHRYIAPPAVYHQPVVVAPAPVYAPACPPAPVYRHAPVYAPAPVIIERHSPSFVIGFGSHHRSSYGHSGYRGYDYGHRSHHGWGRSHGGYHHGGSHYGGYGRHCN